MKHQGLLIAFLTAVMVGGVMVQYAGPRTQASDVSILASCMNPDSKTFDEVCMHARAKELLVSHPPSDLMLYLGATSTPDPVRRACHDIGHAIGQELFAKTRSLDGSLRECTGSCRSGCYHGVTFAAIKENLGDSIEQIDELSVSEVTDIGRMFCGLGRGQCHVVGHMLYQKFLGYLPSLNTCSTIAGGLSREECQRGVFMESSGANNTFFHTLATTSLTGDYGFPCDTISAKYQRSCYSYLQNFQSGLFARNGVNDWGVRQKIELDVCERLSGLSRSYCFEGIGTNMMNVMTSQDELAAVCDARTTLDDRKSCTLGMLSQFDMNSNMLGASRYCAGISESERKSLCYDFIFQQLDRSTPYPSKHTITTFCPAVEDPADCGRALTAYREHKAALPDYFVDGLHGRQW